MLVMKFGGTSVGSSQAVSEVAKIIQEAQKDWSELVVVTSAIAGATNLLLNGALEASAGDTEHLKETVHELRERHLEIARSLIQEEERRLDLRSDLEEQLSEFMNLCEAMAVLGEATPRGLDAVAALGERLSVRLLSQVLQDRGLKAEFVEATRLIVTDGQFQAAHPDLGRTREKARSLLLPMLQKGVIPVVTGFIAATVDGVTTTLGRGGSDYSAALLAAALEASEVWIWTDVDGVMTADPRVVPQAQTIARLNYRELAELAYFGAKVLHPMTIRPVLESGVQLLIKNTFNPKGPGTRLVRRPSEDEAGAIKAVTAIREQKLITLEGRGMLGVPGVAARAFGSVAATGTNVILISQASSEQSITFGVSARAAEEVLLALKTNFAAELANRDIDRIWASEEVVIVTVVGSAMRHTPGVAGKVFSVLGSQNVNVMAIAQGSSEVSISLVVEASEMEQAVRSIHDLIQQKTHTAAE